MLAQSARVVDRLFRPKHDYLPDTEIFRAIDVELVARELKLDALGTRDGAADLPATDSDAEPAAELAITRQVRSYWDHTVQMARRAHDRYAERWRSLTPETEIDTLLGEPGAVRSTLVQAARQDRADLLGLGERVRAERAALASFKMSEVLDRPPDQSKAMALKALIVVLAFAIELGINVTAFASGEEFGIAAAVTKVLAFPALNFGVTGVIIFAFGRHILRKAWGWRVVGFLGFLIATAWALAFNLVIAHWRDGLGASMSVEAGREAITAMTRAPFELHNANSWILFFAGLAAGALGGYEAWILTDPHPGYGKRAAALTAAEAAYAHRLGFGLQRLQHIAASRTAKLKDALLKAETARSRRPELAAHVASLDEDVRAYATHLQGAAADLTTRYREANMRARTTPRPARFDLPPTLELPSPTLSPLGSTSDREIAGLLAQAMKEITAAQDDACQQLPTLEDLELGSA